VPVVGSVGADDDHRTISGDRDGLAEPVPGGPVRERDGVKRRHRKPAYGRLAEDVYRSAVRIDARRADNDRRIVPGDGNAVTELIALLRCCSAEKTLEHLSAHVSAGRLERGPALRRDGAINAPRTLLPR